MSLKKPSRIAVFIGERHGGGVPRMLTNLANGFVDAGVSVDLLLCYEAPYGSILSAEINLVSIDPEQTQDSLTAYFNQIKPEVVLTGIINDHHSVQNALKQISNCPTRHYARSGTNYAEELKTTSWLSRSKRKKQIASAYLEADEMIAVSQGVAQGLAQVCEIDPAQIHVLKNPTVTPYIEPMANEALDHAWFKLDEPLIVSVGSLSRRKNYELLLKSFALVRKTLAAKLIVVGGGKRMVKLQALADKLGVLGDVDFVGATQNPYPYMKHADVTVLSSNREGSPNVLAESLSLQTAVVSTNCQSGPEEILAGGKYGELVPVNDKKALAQGILRALKRSDSAELFEEAINPYLLKNSVAGYLSAFANPKKPGKG